MIPKLDTWKTLNQAKLIYVWEEEVGDKRRKSSENRVKTKEKKEKNISTTYNNWQIPKKEENLNPHLSCSLIRRRVCLCRETIRSLSIPKINI